MERAVRAGYAAETLQGNALLLDQLLIAVLQPRMNIVHLARKHRRCAVLLSLSYTTGISRVEMPCVARAKNG